MRVSMGRKKDFNAEAQRSAERTETRGSAGARRLASAGMTGTLLSGKTLGWEKAGAGLPHSTEGKQIHRCKGFARDGSKSN
jgi:hypothetical protein